MGLINTCKPLSTFILPAPLINLSNIEINFSGTLRIKIGASGCEASMLPNCQFRSGYISAYNTNLAIQRLRLIIKSHACFLLQASSNASGPVSTLNVANVGPQTTSVVQQKTSKAGPDIASMSCISGVKNEIAEEMKITENNLPLFGIETPHEVDLSKVSACEARGPGFDSSSDQIVFSLLGYKVVGIK